ncbi:MAG: hypothetical protein JWM82_3069, partial [Myxococcales bacterium]|nr:hypothetical protein [Myxococcales bacterium]
MTKREDDARAFEEAMRGAHPLPAEARRKRALPAAPPRGPAPRAPRPSAPTSIDVDVPFDPRASAFRIETRGETIEARATGVDARTLLALKSGDT